MSGLIIYGAGGHGQEILQLVLRHNLKFAGFLDESKQEKFYEGFPIINSLTELTKDNGIVLGVGDIINRVKIIKSALDMNFAIFPHIIDKNNYITNTITFNRGVIIFPNCSISTNVILNEFASINYNCSVSHRSIIGKFSNVCPNCTICGDVVIDDFTFIGAGSIINEKVKIGKNVIVASGSVVTSNVPDNVMIAGIPATIKKERTYDTILQTYC